MNAVQKTFLRKMLPMSRLCAESGITQSVLMQTAARSFGASNAYSVKSKFEDAYNKKMAEMAKYPPKM